MYLLTLIIMITATIGQASSASAVRGFSFAVWLVVWRFMLGFGIGGDYPVRHKGEKATTKGRERAKPISTLSSLSPENKKNETQKTHPLSLFSFFLTTLALRHHRRRVLHGPQPRRLRRLRLRDAGHRHPHGLARRDRHHRGLQAADLEGHKVPRLRLEDRARAGRGPGAADGVPAEQAARAAAVDAGK